MTDLELRRARDEYKTQLKGKRKMLRSLSNSDVQTVMNQYFPNVNKIRELSQDEILRNAFLANFRNTKESSKLMVWLNYVQRMDDSISDGQPTIASIKWEYYKSLELIRMNEEVPKLLETLNEANIYNLYCDLETNEPFLISEANKQEFLKKSHQILIPVEPRTETYHYNSHSLERITKGPATESFNRLQLYYFKQLLKYSRKKAVARVEQLTTNELDDICLDKDFTRIYKQ